MPMEDAGRRDRHIFSQRGPPRSGEAKKGKKKPMSQDSYTYCQSFVDWNNGSDIIITAGDLMALMRYAGSDYDGDYCLMIAKVYRPDEGYTRFEIVPAQDLTPDEIVDLITAVQQLNGRVADYNKKTFINALDPEGKYTKYADLIAKETALLEEIEELQAAIAGFEFD